MKEESYSYLLLYCYFLVFTFQQSKTTVAFQSHNFNTAELQKCLTPQELLERVVGVQQTPQTARLVLVRLNKQLLCERNVHGQVPRLSYEKPIVTTLQCLLEENGEPTTCMETLIEGVKACACIARWIHPIDPNASSTIARIVTQTSVWERALTRRPTLEHEHHHITGLQWAMDAFRLVDPTLQIPHVIQGIFAETDTPFRILPGILNNLPSVSDMQSEVQFSVDDIRTSSTEQIVRERRHTAWQGDDNVDPFRYSGKIMRRQTWSPLVRQIRNRLQDTMGNYYDCCLINFYPGDIRSGMRYHSDPDQGVLWSRDTCVVSIGAARRFAIRSKQQQESTTPHNFVVAHGDVTHMFGDCQEDFEHTVKKAEMKTDTSPRISLVFKQSLRSEKKEQTLLSEYHGRNHP